LNDPLDRRTSVEKELDAMRKTSSIDAELEKLKAELGKS